MRQSGRGLNIFNILTAMIVLVTLIAACVLVVVLVAPGAIPGLGQAEDGADAANLPTQVSAASVPTETPTPIFTATATRPNIVPTFTPVAQATATQPATPTRQPTSEATDVFIPSRTATPTATPTETATPTATATEPPNPTSTRSTFLFTKSDDSPRFDEQRFYDVGCNWLGFAGQVFDLNGNAVGSNQFRVHVWEDRSGGIDVRANVGDAPIYGAGGWEQFVHGEPIVWTYFLQLERTNGTPVSQVYQVTTRASCRENLVYVDFVQNHAE